jgi:hypothetical protein
MIQEGGFKRKYWLIGGIIFTLLPILFLICFSFIFHGVPEKIAASLLPHFVLIFYGFSIPVLFFLIIDLIPYFLIGALLGYFFGKTNKKGLLFLTYIPLTVLIFFGMYLFNKEPDYSTYSVSECGNPVYSLQRNFNKNVCYYSAGTRTLDVEACKQIHDGEESACYFTVAKATNNPSICALIAVGNPEMNNCYNVTVQNYACETIPDISSRNTCYIQKAVNKKDPTSCTLITDVGQREHCLSIMK